MLKWNFDETEHFLFSCYQKEGKKGTASDSKDGKDHDRDTAVSLMETQWNYWEENNFITTRKRISSSSELERPT